METRYLRVHHIHNERFGANNPTLYIYRLNGESMNGVESPEDKFNTTLGISLPRQRIRQHPAVARLCPGWRALRRNGVLSQQFLGSPVLVMVEQYLPARLAIGRGVWRRKGPE